MNKIWEWLSWYYCAGLSAAPADDSEVQCYGKSQTQLSVDETNASAELAVTESQEKQVERLAEDVLHAKDIMCTLNDMVQVSLVAHLVWVSCVK